ncbi:hypothetical protein BH11PLA1_BH11PLA1_10780 [soil metagenome]
MIWSWIFNREEYSQQLRLRLFVVGVVVLMICGVLALNEIRYLVWGKTALAEIVLTTPATISGRWIKPGTQVHFRLIADGKAIMGVATIPAGSEGAYLAVSPVVEGTASAASPPMIEVEYLLPACAESVRMAWERNNWSLYLTGVALVAAGAFALIFLQGFLDHQRRIAASRAAGH